MVGGLLAGAGDVQAQSYTWNDTSNNWNSAGSWAGAGAPPPDVAGESAIFGAAAAFLTPTISSFVEVDAITFNAAAPVYTITTVAGGDLTISGPGITNNSAVTQVIANTGGNAIGFENNATAGSGITINNSSANAFLSFNFFSGGSANAGTATINNNGNLAFVVFDSTSSAAGSLINNSGTDSVIRFFSSSTAGTSTINNTSDSGLIDFLDNSSAGSSFINNSADFTVGAGGVQFSGNSTAADSTIINIVANSNTAFSDATAGNAQITNQGDFSNTIFRGASTAGAATIENQGFAAFTSFENTASAGSATISNTGDFTFIQFSDATSAGTSTLINNSLTDVFIFFENNSTAADAHIRNISDNSVLNFFDDSTAGNALIVNSGVLASVIFDDSSSAVNATILNSGPTSSAIFAGMASGGNAAITNTGENSFIDIGQLSTPGTTLGSIAGGGRLFLGSKNLAVGTNNASTTFSGVIQDEGIVVGAFGGSLTKVGLGTLTLTGANTYTGDTVVDAGALIVNGSIASPNTFVNVAGLLGGMGTIGGNLTNRGTVEPGNTPAGLSVNGSYTQTSTGDLRINISSNSTFGKLKVGGVANLDGSVTAVVRDGFKPKRGDTFTFLTANGGVNGEFDELNTNLGTGTILEFDLIYRSNSVSLEVAQGSFREYADENGLTVNQKSVASALDKVAFDKRERRLIDYLNQRSLNDLPGDFDRIAPDELASIYDISFALANVQSLNLQRRTDDIRRGSTGFSAAGLAMNGTGPGYSGPVQFRTGSAGPTGDESKESKSVEIPEESKWGVFLSGVGEWVDVDGDGNARGYEISTGGFTVGIDYKVNPNFAVGLSAGYAGTGADLSDDGRVFVNGGKLGLYATYFTGGFYLDAGLNGGYNSYDTKRTALAGTARGDTEGLEFNALLGTGYDFTIGNLRVGPTATVQYTNVQIDEFKESGSLAPLQIEDQNAESLRTAIGFRASYDIQLRNGMIIRPELRAAWQHEFADRRFALDSRFASGAGSVFTVYGPEYGRDSLLLSAGLTLLLNERTALFLSYDGQLARTDYDSHAVSGGVRVAF